MRNFATYLVLAALVGCTTGQDFPKPAPESLVLGQSMRAEILRTYGQPYRQTSAVISSAPTEAQTKGEFDMTPVSGSFATLVYLYVDRTGQLLVGQLAPAAKQKIAAFDFWNDTLIAYNFMSTFANDSSNFDDSKIAEIRKGRSTRADVTQHFGPPAGRAIYPTVQHQGNEKYIYGYIEIRNNERSLKRLEVLVGADGKVIDYRFVADTSPLPARPASASTPVPVYIPQPHR